MTLQKTLAYLHTHLNLTLAVTLTAFILLAALQHGKTLQQLRICKAELTETQGYLEVHKELLTVPVHNANITAQKILKLQPNLDERTAFWYGFIIGTECPIKMQNTIISIIFAESSFDHLKKSGTGDYGLGQTNYRVWGQFFGVTRNELLNPVVSIRITVTILQMAKVSHGKKSDWYAYYHSWNRMPRQVYKKKIDKILAKIDACANGTCELNYDR